MIKINWTRMLLKSNVQNSILISKEEKNYFSIVNLIRKYSNASDSHVWTKNNKIEI